MFDFLENAKVLVAYKNYLLYSACLTVVFLVTWAVFLCIHRKDTEERRIIARGSFISVMFCLGMLAYAVINTLQALTKHHEREEQCYKTLSVTSEEDSEGLPSSKEAWQSLSTTIEYLSELNVLEFVVACKHSWVSFDIEVVGYWLVCLGLSIWVCARHRYKAKQREWLCSNLKKQGQNVHSPDPSEATIRRNTLFRSSVYSGPEVEKCSLLHYRLLSVNEMLVSFWFDIGSFLLLQQAKVPGETAAWFPWKLIWELFITAIIKGCISKVCRCCGTALLVFVMILSIGAILALIAILAVTLWGFWEDDIALRLIRILDIAVGVGLVGCLLTPLSIEMVSALFSTTWWEPRIRHRFTRVVVLETGEDVTRFKELLRDAGKKGLEWFADEFVSSYFVAVSVFNSLGIRLDAKTEKDKLATLDSLSQDDLPITVHIVNGRASCFSKLKHACMDFLLGVDKANPVKPLMNTSALCCCVYWKREEEEEALTIDAADECVDVDDEGMVQHESFSIEEMRPKVAAIEEVTAFIDQLDHMSLSADISQPKALREIMGTIDEMYQQDPVGPHALEDALHTIDGDGTTFTIQQGGIAYTMI